MAHIHRRSRGGEGMLIRETSPKAATCAVPQVAATLKEGDVEEADKSLQQTKYGDLSRTNEMPVLGVRQSKVTHPTGDPKFSVLQAFPAGFSAEEADPFLMCDEFGPMVSKGAVTDPDEFPVDWHPHRGFDLLTYMTEGWARHADSMGNRESFPAPAIQWISSGSGIEHAEAGGTPTGQVQHGFQIWINVPSCMYLQYLAEIMYIYECTLLN